MKAPVRNIVISAGLATLCLTKIAIAADFTFDIESPKARVTLPKVPELKLEPHPLSAKQPHLKLLGSSDDWTVSVLAPTADQGMTPADCATSVIGALSKRPRAPTLDKIFRARIDEKNFIALYPAPIAGGVMLHAHLVSAAPGHCIEVHVSKVVKSEQEIKPWFSGWGTARIES
jgi:hypothetical protein